MPQEKFSINKRIRSFKYAFDGITVLLREEHNSRIHFFAAILAVSAGLYFGIDNTEWLALVLTIGLVVICEVFNSAIENIADFISPNKHEMIKKIKDLGAAAVLLSAILAVIVGLIIFLPKIVEVIHP